MPPNVKPPSHIIEPERSNNKVIRCAILGCGMMGQEHCSYILGFPQEVQIRYICDPHEPSLTKCGKVFTEFSSNNGNKTNAPAPVAVRSEQELYDLYRNGIDLLVVATPNYQHAATLLLWGQLPHLTILLEKPAAVSTEQLQTLQAADLTARVWVAMEYRFIPAIAKLIELLDSVGDIKMITIRENRYPFLHKIGEWNRDRSKTGDTLVEKWYDFMLEMIFAFNSPFYLLRSCHFFDLMRLITGKEATLNKVRALAQRGLNYEDEEPHEVPIMDAAYVTMPFKGEDATSSTGTIGCLELCMYAEGSRHQEEIIVTGTKGRLEAYLPENKVYQYQRPTVWKDRSEPPPAGSVNHKVYDCSDVAEVHGIDSSDLPTHGGYHYSSTAVEWYRLLAAMHAYEEDGIWSPSVSLNDGLRAVEIGLAATQAIVNEQQ